MLQCGHIYEFSKRMSQPQEPEKNPIAVAFGKLGAAKGGRARAAKLSAKRRSDIARKAAQVGARKLGAKGRSALARKAAQARWIGKKK